MNKRKLPPDVLLQVDILKGAGQTPSVTKLKNISSQFINLKKASEKGTSIHLKRDKNKSGKSKLHHKVLTICKIHFEHKELQTDTLIMQYSLSRTVL